MQRVGGFPAGFPIGFFVRVSRSCCGQITQPPRKRGGVATFPSEIPIQSALIAIKLCQISDGGRKGGRRKGGGGKGGGARVNNRLI